MAANMARSLIDELGGHHDLVLEDFNDDCEDLVQPSENEDNQF